MAEEPPRETTAGAPAYEPIPLEGYRPHSVAESEAAAERVRARLATRRTVRDFAERPVSRATIETLIAVAASAPSGANLQPWRFVAIADPDLKRRIRAGAEAEERAFYEGRAGQEWLEALRPLGTDADKTFLERAPWLLVVFGARRPPGPDGAPRKAYYVPESVSIAVGFLIAAAHEAGLASLTHTPSPMGFLNELCGRPSDEKPYFLLVLGYPAEGATVPAYAARRRPLAEIATFLESPDGAGA